METWAWPEIPEARGSPESPVSPVYQDVQVQRVGPALWDGWADRVLLVLLGLWATGDLLDSLDPPESKVTPGPWVARGLLVWSVAVTASVTRW